MTAKRPTKTPGMDFVKQLGELAFATRLRRLSDRLLRDASRLYEEHAFDFRARWFPLLYLLQQDSPLALTDAAHRLGLTHPAVNQMAAAMTRRDLLISNKGKTDERLRLLRLTAKGKKLARQLSPLWRNIESATGEILEEAGYDCLAVIEQIENAFNAAGLYQRVMKLIKQQQYDAIRIIDYKPKYKRHFKSLNYEWLSRYFSVERKDELLLSDPHSKIINTGGQVFFALLDGDVVGTTAVIYHSNDTYEIAKMAVTGKAQRKQVGLKLAHRGLDYAAKLKAKRVIIQTNHKLTAALMLYSKLGFRPLDGGEIDLLTYDRETTVMQLDIKDYLRSKKLKK